MRAVLIFVLCLLHILPASSTGLKNLQEQIQPMTAQTMFGTTQLGFDGNIYNSDGSIARPDEAQDISQAQVSDNDNYGAAESSLADKDDSGVAGSSLVDRGVGNDIVNFVKGAVSAVGKALGHAWEWTRNAFSTIGQGFKDAWSAVGKFISSIGGKVKKMVIHERQSSTQHITVEQKIFVEAKVDTKECEWDDFHFSHQTSESTVETKTTVTSSLLDRGDFSVDGSSGSVVSPDCSAGKSYYEMAFCDAKNSLADAENAYPLNMCGDRKTRPWPEDYFAAAVNRYMYKGQITPEGFVARGHRVELIDVPSPQEFAGCWVVFRGTASLQSMLSSANFLDSQLPASHGVGRAKYGLEVIYRRISKHKNYQTFLERCTQKKKKFYFTGHSLGGGIAAYATMAYHTKLIQDGFKKEELPSINAILIASPKVGNKQFVEHLHAITDVGQGKANRMRAYATVQPKGKYVDQNQGDSKFKYMDIVVELPISQGLLNAIRGLIHTASNIWNAILRGITSVFLFLVPQLKKTKAFEWWDKHILDGGKTRENWGNHINHISAGWKMSMPCPYQRWGDFGNLKCHRTEIYQRFMKFSCAVENGQVSGPTKLPLAMSGDSAQMLGKDGKPISKERLAAMQAKHASDQHFKAAHKAGAAGAAGFDAETAAALGTAGRGVSDRVGTQEGPGRPAVLPTLPGADGKGGALGGVGEARGRYPNSQGYAAPGQGVDQTAKVIDERMEGVVVPPASALLPGVIGTDKEVQSHADPTVVQECAACLLVMGQAELMLGNTDNEPLIAQTISNLCAETLGTLLEGGCLLIHRALDDLATDYLDGKSTDQICEHNALCRGFGTPHWK